MCDPGIEHGYLLEDGSSFRWLKIEDSSEFGIMCAGVKKKKGIKQDYSRMDLVINDCARGNLQNLTMDEYKTKIKKVLKYLEEEYGVIIDSDTIKFSEMEINCTFLIKEEFSKYHRALQLLMFNLPRCYKKLNKTSAINKAELRLEDETFCRSSTREGIKIYDKSRQLEQVKNIKLDSQYMRVEITLKTTKKIQEALGSALVNNINDEKVNSFYMKEIERLFEKPYKKWRKNNGKVLRKLVETHKENSSRSWKNNLLRECCNIEQKNQVPMLLDIRHLLDVIKEMENNGHYARVEAGVYKACCENDVYLQQDSDKVEEIFQKIHMAYDRFANSKIRTTICGEAA